MDALAAARLSRPQRRRRSRGAPPRDSTQRVRHDSRRSALCPALLFTQVAAGCAFLGEDDPPETQAPEVVVESTRVDKPCLLNDETTSAGVHPVLVISERRPATVSIVNPAGTTVFRMESASEEEGGESSVRLDAGTYSVRCQRPGRAASDTTLTVEPARR